MRLVILIVALTVLFLIPLFVFGDRFDVALSGDVAAAKLRAYGPWAWMVGMGLIVSDLILPIPATAVMAALGFVYGAIIGGVVGASGSILAGLIAYGATRLLGRRAALFLVGEGDLARTEQFFQKRGALAVAASRPMPLLPEVIACLAGLAGMRFRLFFLSLCCGSIPTAVAFAAVGAMGVDRPSLALGIGIIVPVLLWIVVDRLNRRFERSRAGEPGRTGDNQDVAESGRIT